jgi:hypothetical protein
MVLILLCSTGLARGEANPLRQVLEQARSYVGSSYCRGSSSPPCFDCSGFVYHLLHSHIDGLPRTSRKMARFGSSVSRSDLQPGDLLFFETTPAPGVISHVALYLGGQSIIHAISDGPNRGVNITPMNARYWRSRYHSAVRVLPASERAAGAPAEARTRESSDAAGSPASPARTDEAVRFAKGSYTGQLRGGEPHGTGTMEFDNGDLYRGEFADGQMHGRGVYVWADGSRYEGEFRRGTLHGSGVYTAADGQKIKGPWRRGEPAGDTALKTQRQPYSEVHDSPWDEWDGHIQGDFYAWQREEQSDFEAWKEQNSGY